jgi:hypothetical protein
MATTHEQAKKILDDLLADWVNDSKIDKAMPADAAAENSSLHAKYLKVFANHELNIKEAEREYLKMRRIRLAYYEGTLTEEELKKYGWQQYLGKAPKTASQKEELLNSDPYLMEITKCKEIYEIIVDKCERILKEIHGREFMIPAYMNWEMKIRNG